MMTERQARARLDSWRLWVMIAYAGIIVLFLLTVYLVNAKFSQDADRRAQQKIANTTQVAACITAARSTPNVLKFLDLIDVLTSNSIKANEAALSADPNGPLAKIRRDSLRRLRPAVPTIKLFRKATIDGRRTIAECKLLAANLDVNITPLLKEGRT